MNRFPFIIIVLLSYFSYGQNSFYKISNDFVNYSVLFTNLRINQIIPFKDSSSYLLRGKTPNYNTKNLEEPILYKMDATGNFKYGKLIRKDKQITGSAVLMTNNNEILFGGSYNIYYGFLLKMDLSGNLLWSKKYDSCMVLSVVQTNNNYFIGVVTSNGFIKGHKNDIAVIKTDTSGNVIWTKAFGGYKTDVQYQMIQTKDGGLLCVGLSQSVYSVEGRTNSYIVKLDSVGNLQWAKVYDYVGQGSTMTERVIQIADSNYVLYVKPQDNTRFYQSLMKIDQKGNVLWAKEYYTDWKNNTFSAGNLIEIGNNDILSTAYIDVSDKEIRPLLLKTNDKGEVVWQKQYNRINDSLNLEFDDFSLSQDKGIIFVGGGAKFVGGNTYLFMNIIKTDTAGLGCGTITPIKTWTLDRQVLVTDLDTVTEINVKYSDYPFEVIDIAPNFKDECVITGEAKKLMVKNDQLLIYPNPATTTIQVEPPTNTGTLQITDLNGKVVLTMPIKELKENVNVIALPQGLYFVRAITGGSVYNGRFVKIAE